MHLNVGGCQAQFILKKNSFHRVVGCLFGKRKWANMHDHENDVRCSAGSRFPKVAQKCATPKTCDLLKLFLDFCSSKECCRKIVFRLMSFLWPRSPLSTKSCLSAKRKTRVALVQKTSHFYWISSISVTLPELNNHAESCIMTLLLWNYRTLWG